MLTLFLYGGNAPVHSQSADENELSKYDQYLVAQLSELVKEAPNLPPEEITLPEYENTAFYKSYRKACAFIQAERKKVGADALQAPKAKKLFLRGFQALFRFWEGTVWDFNGKTTFPRRGTVSCGNFVFNLMKDLGVKFPERITSTAPIYRGRGRVNIWQTLSAEQVQVYSQGKVRTYRSIRNDPREKGRFIYGLADQSFPFFIVGEADHIVIMAPLMDAHNTEQPLLMHKRLGVFDAHPGDRVKVEPVEYNLDHPRSNIMVVGILERTIEDWLK
jgi:hypothetical protein